MTFMYAAQSWTAFITRNSPFAGDDLGLRSRIFTLPALRLPPLSLFWRGKPNT